MSVTPFPKSDIAAIRKQCADMEVIQNIINGTIASLSDNQAFILQMGRVSASSDAVVKSLRAFADNLEDLERLAKLNGVVV